MRVVLADDHPVVRAGVRRILERSEEIDVVGEADDGRVLLRQVQALHPDLVVLDVTMPELNGIDATRAIRRDHPSTRVLVLSVHCTEACVVAAIEAGATGYVLKEAASEELLGAVQALANGQGYFSPAVAALLANRLVETNGRGAPLSPREREVVQLLAEGRGMREIARKLFISIATVKSHRASVMRKLGSRTTADLIRYAIRCGLTSL